MTYYTYYPSEYLAHHGIKGRKWGVRRYQNPDGSLTEAGRARYGDSLSGSKNPSNKGYLRRAATGDFAVLGTKRYADRQEERMRKLAEKVKASGKNAERYEKNYETQKKQNIDRDKYLANTSTAKLVAQNFIMGPIGSHLYRNARARNESRASAFVEAIVAPAIGITLDQHKMNQYYSQQ